MIHQVIEVHSSYIIVSSLHVCKYFVEKVEFVHLHIVLRIF